MRSHARASVVVIALFAFFAVAAPSAFAAYVEVGTFAGGGSGPGGSGSADGQLSNPGQADVSDATGNLYVADTNNNRVQVFKPNATAGEYDSQAAITAPIGLAIDQDTGDVYVSNATGISKLTSALTPAAGWTDPAVTGPLAVDPSTGDLLVGDTAANLVRRFEADGTAAGTFAAERPIDLAADSTGDVLVVTSTGNVTLDCAATSTVKRYSGAGVEEGTVGASLTAPGAVAVDSDDDSIVIGARVNQYNCGPQFPQVAFFDSAGVETESRDLAADTQYAMIPGLAAQGDGSTRVYAITRSPANDGFGATKVAAFEIPAPVAPQIGIRPPLRGANDATLRATINAGGLATDYHFEYGATVAYGQNTEEQSLPASFDAAKVAAAISGLSPGTTYHYRVVAQNSLGVTPGPGQTLITQGVESGCPNDAFRTGAAAFLTDCRAYELVTPIGSRADIRVGGSPGTPDGGTVCFDSEDPLAGSAPNGIKLADDGFCAWRGANGWETRWVTGPAPAKQQTTGQGSNVYFLSSDGQRAVFASDANIFGADYLPPLGSASGGVMSAYMWEAGDTRWLAPAGSPLGDPPLYPVEGKTRPDNGSESGRIAERRPLATSTDLSHGIFESDLQLASNDENEVVDVYEWYPGGIRVVSTDASGKAASGRAGIQAFGQMLSPPGSVSADGSRIFFMHDGAPLAGDAPEGDDPEDPGDPERSGAGIQSVYMREGDEITHVSPRRGSGPDTSVWFVGASADGDVAYLETTQQLTPESKEPGRAIYSFDVAADELTLLADGPEGVQMLGFSADASTFVYRQRDSSGLVVSRNGTATPLGTVDVLDRFLLSRVASDRLDQRALRISKDGAVVVFASAGEFAGNAPGPVRVYRWEAGHGLDLISVNPGEEQTADASIGTYPTFFPGNAREEIFNTHKEKPNLGRVISDDGSRVFFETPEALVSRDVNGATDVYEWHDGEINLVSPGTGGKSLYHESSADGKTVFFLSFDRLLPEFDRNNNRDVYVAQPGGGFPPPTPPDCEAELCQSAPPPPLANEVGRAGAGIVADSRPAASVAALSRRQLAQPGEQGTNHRQGQGRDSRQDLRGALREPGRPQGNRGQGKQVGLQARFRQPRAEAVQKGAEAAAGPRQVATHPRGKSLEI